MVWFRMAALLACACIVVGIASGTAEASYNDYYYMASNGFNLPYWIDVPDNYDPSKSYPLLMYWHGSGNGGTDNLGPHHHPNATELRNYAHTPGNEAIVIIPQTSNSWDADSRASVALLDLIDNELIGAQGYNIDTDRFYITGFSLGGVGIFSWTSEIPERVAAVAPFAGSMYWNTDSEQAATNRATVATWAFSGGNDWTIQAAWTREELSRQNAYGGEAMHTTYPGEGHNDTWQAVKAEEIGLYAWMYAQRNGQATDMSMFVGWEMNTDETVTLDGPGESVTRSDEYFVGYYGTGTFELRNGAVMTDRNGYVSANRFGRGNALVTGAGSRWVNSGVLDIGARNPGSLHLADDGEIAASGGVKVRAMSYLTGAGSVVGNLDVWGVIAPGGQRVELVAKSLSGTAGGRFPPPNPFDDLVVNAMAEDGTVLDAPVDALPAGSVITVEGNLALKEEAAAEIIVTGDGPSLVASGRVFLDGLLSLQYADDLAPTNGQIFEIIHSDDALGVVGQFAEVEGQHHQGFYYNLFYDTHDVKLVAIADLPGDANADGSVDLLDFARLQTNFGRRDANWEQADFNLDGVVNLADFVILKNNYGATRGVVPEPAVMALLIAAAPALRRRRR